MLMKIDALTGQGLMRLWGVTDWPDVDGEYLLYDGSIVAVIQMREGFADVHMAGKPKNRHLSRAFGVEIIKRLNGVPIRLIIKEGNPVVNLAKRLGFEDKGIQTIDLINGGLCRCHIMYRG